MVTKETADKPLRLWPGSIIVIIQMLGLLVVPKLFPGAMICSVSAAVLGGPAIIIWWCFFSRARIPDRLLAIVLIISALLFIPRLIDKSIATGNMGLMFYIYSIPFTCLAFVIWAVISSHLSKTLRRITMVFTILISSGVWILLRSDGINGTGQPKIDWRWKESYEDRLIKETVNDNFEVPAAGDILKKEAEWPGFRGPNRDGVIHDKLITTNWNTNKPEELWRIPIGPGCSSVSINGDLIYTQEQRGEFEIVSCYNLKTGSPIWKHRDKTRFYDSHAGAGPRSTPAISGNKVYTLGATGIMNALDATSGSVLWTRNTAVDCAAKLPVWGFTGSPLVVNDVVIVAMSGDLGAYDSESGTPKWFWHDGGSGYSSPQLLKLGGKEQVVMMSSSGAVSLDMTCGRKLWKYPWPAGERILQPALIDNNDLLITSEMKEIRRISVSQGPDSCVIKEIWTSSAMKTYFNDMVINKGYAYGFDGPFIVCIDARNGKKLWRGNRYQGWILLLADQDLLLVLTEKGEVALVKASPDKFTELARFQAIHGRTWNHPALSGNILVVRNSQEMAAFRLPSIEMQKTTGN